MALRSPRKRPTASTSRSLEPPGSWGFLSVFPGDESWGGSSSINWDRTNQTIANNAYTWLGLDDGTVNVHCGTVGGAAAPTSSWISSRGAVHPRLRGRAGRALKAAQAARARAPPAGSAAHRDRCSAGRRRWSVVLPVGLNARWRTRFSHRALQVATRSGVEEASRVEPDQITVDAERWVGATCVEPSTQPA